MRSIPIICKDFLCFCSYGAPSLCLIQIDMQTSTVGLIVERKGWKRCLNGLNDRFQAIHFPLKELIPIRVLTFLHPLSGCSCMRF